MKFEMSSANQTIKVYNLRDDTSEFIGAGEVFIPAHTGLPANCTTIIPPETPVGKVAVFDDNSGAWSVLEDYRGKTVYDLTSGLPVIIDEIGPIPENTTSVAITGPYQKWDGEEWITDVEAEKSAQIAEAEATKTSLMRAATTAIEPLQDAIDLEIATEDEEALLTAWKNYRVLLNRVDTSLAPEIVWPAVPASA